MSKFVRWIPATIIMAVIFIFSSTPAVDLPNYGFWDTLVKKGGHMTGYGLLAGSYWYGLGFNRKKGCWLAWLLAVLYAATDEFHQSFTPGRHPSPVDVLLFDGGGAALALWLASWFLKLREKKQAKTDLTQGLKQ
jgi:VanZ family protein